MNQCVRVAGDYFYLYKCAYGTYEIAFLGQKNLTAPYTIIRVYTKIQMKILLHRFAE